MAVALCDTEGAPIANAMVTVSGPTPGAGNTDDHGLLMLYKRAPGDYQATIVLPPALDKRYKTPGKLSCSVGIDDLRVLSAILQRKPKIVSIDILDSGGRIAADNCIQWVNWNRDGRHPRLKVSFDQPGAHRFAVQCLPGAANATYSAAEVRRNVRFRYQRAVKVYTTAANGTLVLPRADFPLTAAGNDSYVFRAMDINEVEVTSQRLQTRRLIYYVEIKMNGLAAALSGHGAVAREFAKHGIQLLKLPSVNVPYLHNLGNAADVTRFEGLARSAYRNSFAVPKQPYALAVAYTDHLAVINPNVLVTTPRIAVGPRRSSVVVAIVAPSLTSTALDVHPLCMDVDPRFDWFVSAIFIPDGSSRGTVIPKSACTPIPDDAGQPQVATKVSINVSQLTAGAGTIRLKVNVVDRMRSGIASIGGNMICIASRTWWENISDTELVQTLTHEIGHMIGMVPNGVSGLDRTATWYDGQKGHVGNHCFKGLPATQARYDGNGDSDHSLCVMYGSDNDHSDFCSDCAPAVRKLDLGDGWTPF
ncbi:hypothetical protein [Duganella caerulea]|uniref:hypothetical protein n=1 Tax=Duganella caerulea TaxID=2885762 RepID=UPI0040376353